MSTRHDVGEIQYHRPTRTIRFQLLVPVNFVLACFVLVVLANDYRQELAERLEVKQIALEEEAKTLLPAVRELQHHGQDRVQRYIDAVCRQMQESHSPGHHIAVEWLGNTIQATAHHRASPEMFSALRQAADSDSHRAHFGTSDLVVGTHKHGDMTVYVSESLDNLYRSVISDVFCRLAILAFLALLAVGIVNIVLYRVVTRPLDRLVATVRKIGSGQLGVQADSFDTTELNYLASEINAMSRSLAEATAYRRRQLEKARETQQNLLPRVTDISGVNVGYLFEPADDIGGDYYDTLPIGDEAWLFCVADVTGHGVPAAMIAAILKSLVNQVAKTNTSPAKMLSSINQSLIAINPSGDLATMFLALLAPESGRLIYASAGHEPAWWLSAQGDIHELKSTGLILGVTEDATWDEITIHMSECDRLLIVTDGVSETFNSQGQMLGRQRVAQWFAECASYSVEETATRMHELLARHRGEVRQMDDVTTVLIEMTRLVSDTRVVCRS